MKHTKLTSALAALAIAAVLGTSAHAQVAGYNEGDLLIGFEQISGNGVSASDYVVDLGSAGLFINATTPLTFNLSTANLTTAFGASWASNSATGLLQWGVVGASDNASSITTGGSTLAKNTLFYTLAEQAVGTHSTAPATASNSTQGNIDNNIQGFAADYAATQPTTSGSIIPSTDPNGWSASSPATSAFGSGKNIEQPNTGLATGPTDSELDLYRLNNTTTTPGSTATLLGDFTLSSAGVLTFTSAAAVPEPSSYALAALAAVTFIVLRRRKAISAQ